MSTARLDELILAETREVKKRQRQRRSGLRNGPGRPDFTDLGGGASVSQQLKRAKLIATLVPSKYL